MWRLLLVRSVTAEDASQDMSANGDVVTTMSAPKESTAQWTLSVQTTKSMSMTAHLAPTTHGQRRSGPTTALSVKKATIVMCQELLPSMEDSAHQDLTALKEPLIQDHALQAPMLMSTVHLMRKIARLVQLDPIVQRVLQHL